MKTIKKKINGFTMYLDSSRIGISGTLKSSGYREPAFMWILDNEAEGDVAIDVGANIGYTTLPLCKRMNKVLAIEPDERSRNILEKNIEINGYENKTDIFKFAISDKEGTKKIYLNKHPNLSSLCESSKGKAVKISKISTKTIDSLNVEPNFIKMDIEGYEVEALRGAMKCLEKTSRCKILMEVHPQYYSKNHSLELVLKDLLKIGFNFKYVVSAGVAVPKYFKKRGYAPIKVFKGIRYPRGLYDNLSNDDAVDFCSHIYEHPISYSRGGKTIHKISKKIVRSVLLVKEC